MSVFSHIKIRKPKSSTFDLSHQKKLSAKMGELVPIFCMETVPGDEFKINTAQLLRMAPMLAPIFHQITVYQHFFFVPNRLLWDNWEGFITGGEDGYNSSVRPFITTTGAPNGTVADYFGIPENVYAAGLNISALPFSAYGIIYNEYYRDQNLITPLAVKCNDGLQSGNDLATLAAGACLKRAWQHDYFTSALPWTQKGPEATIPLGTSAPITWSNNGPDITRNVDSSSWAWTVNYDLNNTATTDFSGILRTDVGGGTYLSTSIDNSANLETDLSNATAATINDLRSAFRLQEWLEKNARGGSRYIESILSHFGVRSSDARLQRPEFLGGGSVPIQVSEVLQTAPAVAGSTPLAEMAGHGIAVGSNSSIQYRCEEHGFIIGIMSVMPKTAYQDGINKMFFREDRFDYFWPEFAHLGEQEVLNKEIYANAGPMDLNGTFGYVPRYSEYKYQNDTVHGEMRNTLDFWHLGRKFANLPSLNQTFIECDPSDRIFAVLEAEQLYAIINHRVEARRPMPYFGTPTF